MIYTYSALVAVALAVLLDLVVVRTRLLTTRLFWASYAIVVFFQFLVNGVLTGLKVVSYDPARILGPRLFFAPIEDVAYGFALVTLVLIGWVRRTRPRVRPGARPGERG